MLRTDIKLRAFALVLAGACTAPGALAAQQIPQSPAPVRFEVRGWPDAVVATVGIALSSLPHVISDSVVSPCPCDPGGLPRIDRGTVGPVAAGPARWSNITLGATLGLAGAGLLLARPGEPWEARAEDLAVLGQAVLLTNGLTQVLKTVAQRPRPYVYDGSPAGDVSRDDVASFPSGHASNAFAAAAAYWSIQQRRGVAGRHTPEVVGLFALATATAGLWVAAHKHFPTDVLAGAVLGTAVGWALPQLHAVH
jgi:membrane-associated phospholipid phosphatase